MSAEHKDPWEIEMYDEPWYTMENLLEMFWMGVVICTAVTFLWFVIGFAVGYVK